MMNIRELTLFTNALEEQKLFYSEKMGFELVADGVDLFSIQVGVSKLRFKRSRRSYKYHYCFLIPSNKLDEAILWLKDRTEIISIEGERVIQRFDTWNADSVYFFDGSGNLVEFIARYDLENDTQEDFTKEHIIGVNEIGIPTRQIGDLNQTLEHQLNTKFWKGDKNRFGTNGDQHGMFLLPNYEIKKTWFPTTLQIEPAPVEACIENENQLYEVKYVGEKLTITR